MMAVMTMKRSPITGDVGFGDLWLRMRPGTFGLAQPSLFVDISDLHMLDLAAEGFERIADHDPTVPVSRSKSLAADVWSRHDVDLVNPSGARVAGAVFEDPHPGEWWTPIHEAGQLAVFVGDGGPFRNNTPLTRNWMEGVYMAILPLTIRAWDDGVGTARSDQS